LYIPVVNDNLNKLKKDKKELEERIQLTQKNMSYKHDEVNIIFFYWNYYYYIIIKYLIEYNNW